MLTLTKQQFDRPVTYIPTVTLQGRTIPLHDFDEMDRLELTYFRRAVEGELHDIISQLEAEELAPSRDEEWLIRATRAKRAYTRALHHIDATIEIRKLEHQRTLLQHFINTAEKELPPSTFKRLLKQAHILANKDNDQ